MAPTFLPAGSSGGSGRLWGRVTPTCWIIFWAVQIWVLEIWVLKIWVLEIELEHQLADGGVALVPG